MGQYPAFLSQYYYLLMVESLTWWTHQPMQEKASNLGLAATVVDNWIKASTWHMNMLLATRWYGVKLSHLHIILQFKLTTTTLSLKETSSQHRHFTGFCLAIGSATIFDFLSRRRKNISMVDHASNSIVCSIYIFRYPFHDLFGCKCCWFGFTPCRPFT